MQPKLSKELFQHVFWEVLTYVVYVGGILLIECGPRSLGVTRLPLLPDLTLKGMELAFLLAIATKVAKGLDAFVTALTRSVAFKAILNCRRKKKAEPLSKVKKALPGEDDSAVTLPGAQESSLKGDPSDDFSQRRSTR